MREGAKALSLDFSREENMSYLIPEIALSEFKKMNVEKIRQSQSFVLTSDGEYLATVIIPQTDYIKMQAEFMGELSNGVKPGG
jgi:hypothetical protein